MAPADRAVLGRNPMAGLAAISSDASDLTGPHWLDDRPDLCCKDDTRQDALADWRLSSVAHPGKRARSLISHGQESSFDRRGAARTRRRACPTATDCPADAS
jgi:hypothetical protein